MCTKYFFGVFVRGSVHFFRTYLRLAIAELKFLYKLLTLPLKEAKMQALQSATKTWLAHIRRAFLPEWMSAFAKSPSRLGRLLVFAKLLKEIIVYVYNCFVLKQLLVIGISECLRLKRLVAKNVNKSRRLRVIDPRN